MSRNRECAAEPRERGGLSGHRILRTYARLISAAAAIFASQAAAAQTYQGVAFAGASAGPSEAGAYAGAVVALPGGKLGKGFAVRASMNGGQYEYLANGAEVDATYRGAEAALVYQISGAWGWANFSAGPRLSKLKLSPVDTANSRRGTHLDAGVQVDGAIEANKWRLNWLGSVTLDDSAYLAQLSIGRLIEDVRQSRIGAEAALQGDERYTKVSAGAFASTRIGRNVEGRLSVGASDQKGRRARPYVSAATILLF